LGVKSVQNYSSTAIPESCQGPTPHADVNGRRIARSRDRNMRDTMKIMEKKGLIRLGSGKLPKDFWKIPKPEDAEGLVLKALLEEREGGR
jgi:hypothetical protein